MLERQAIDIQRLHAAYDAGTKPEEIVEECYRRIQTADDQGIFLHLIDKESVLRDALALGDFDPHGKPLWGIPFAIKDNIDASGTPTTAACPAYSYNADQDAFVVKQLRDAGALLIGKTNLDQFATGLVGVRTPYTPPRNAIDPSLVPGGSSSGSAVAVGLGLVSFALGTDTAGSGRVPAALNNIVGLKPSLGTVSNSGVVPACRTLDAVSIFALTSQDAYAVFQSMQGFDVNDAYSRPSSERPLIAPEAGLRIGIPNDESLEFFGDNEQEKGYRQSVQILRNLGAEPLAIDFHPFHEVASMLYDGAWVAERLTVIEQLIGQMPDQIHPVTRQIIERGQSLTAVDAFRGFYRLKALRRSTEALMAGVDALAVPSIPTTVTLEEIGNDPIEPNSRLGFYTNFVNLLDLCAITVPVVPRADGLPGGGLTLIARHGNDARLAGIAKALQYASPQPLGATGLSMPADIQAQPSPADDEIALAVVGAHMRGLPLNKELSSRDARFLYAAQTAPRYRFYRLEGGPPFRPGLVETDDGASIDLEVWAIPQARFGEFLRGVPKPLCIGTLQLNDGSEVKGFLCESIGTKGALDITAYGGWRSFTASLNTPLNSNEDSQHATT